MSKCSFNQCFPRIAINKLQLQPIGFRNHGVHWPVGIFKVAYVAKEAVKVVMMYDFPIFDKIVYLGDKPVHRFGNGRAVARAD